MLEEELLVLGNAAWTESKTNESEKNVFTEYGHIWRTQKLT